MGRLSQGGAHHAIARIGDSSGSPPAKGTGAEQARPVDECRRTATRLCGEFGDALAALVSSPRPRWAEGSPRLRRRIRLHARPYRAPHLGTARPDAVRASLGSPRSDLGDLGPLGQPRPSAPRPLLPVAPSQHPPGRGLRVSLSSAAPSPWTRDRALGSSAPPPSAAGP